ncbi:hypothetical protein TWF694_001175 [Orbilia ellipsospora]|uniref:Metallo-beta-lactamase domain-containing protein n=1 Tax=Orbilia ellipsospora TaxID=2528407 RepID=A0AAV9XSB9_9PEZI
MKPTFKFPYIASKLKQPNPPADNDDTKINPAKPIITHLNADTTWLLLLPYPSTSSPRPTGDKGRKYYRILFDPWLSGPQSDYFSWFSTQWHAVSPALGSIAQVEEFILSVDTESVDGKVDLVIISHEFTDHCHRGTLVELGKGVPVLVNDKAGGIVRSWGHFENVVEVGKFPKSVSTKMDSKPKSDTNGQSNSKGDGETWDWRAGGRVNVDNFIPDWIGITRLESPGNALYYHSSIMVVWQSSTDDGNGKVESIVYTPHGTVAETLETLNRCEPKVEVVGLLHGLHDVRVGLVRFKQLNLGMQNAIKAVKGVNGGEGVKYWIGTHDEVKKAGGIVGRMLWRREWKVDEVVDEAVRGCYVEVGNGESLVLE